MALAAALTDVIETKETLAGVRKTFRCRLLARDEQEMVVLFVSQMHYRVHNLDLPPGTITFGYFWRDRPFNVYHWMSSQGTTLAHYFNLSDRTVLDRDHLSWRDLAVDVLISAKGEITVLDEHELPLGIDGQIRARVEQGKNEIVRERASLVREIEDRSSVLWPQVFHGPRR